MLVLAGCVLNSVTVQRKHVTEIDEFIPRSQNKKKKRPSMGCWGPGYNQRMNDTKEARGGDREKTMQELEGKLELYCGSQRSDQ